MKKLGWCLLSTCLFLVGLGAAVSVVGAAQPPRPTATTLASGNLPTPVHAVMVAPSDMGTTAGMAEVTEIRMVRFELEPGGAFPWHQHPGPVWVVVTRGTLTFYTQTCAAQAFPTGSAFFDPGNLTHTARNEGTEPVEVLATFMFPANAGAASVPHPASDACPVEV
jgi:quercetin dioxygenase-like cupin family protein